MTIHISTILLILAAHWVADFKLQTHWQASNKSKSNIALLRHVSTYILVILLAGIFLLGPVNGVLWGLFNGVIHFITDYITSRMSSKRWEEQRWHDFFEVVGADQFCHYATLFLTYLIFN